jgi:hydroxyacylglutathione hydrolase
MILERVRSEGIAHFSYLVGSGHNAAVIDPRRDCDAYVELAKEEGLRIQYILETHRNEDCVTGSVELAQVTGARILHGSSLDFRFGEAIVDKDEFVLGDLRIEAIHTPGHTDESMSYVLRDLSVKGEPVTIFSGDTLFVGEVGRTDLYGPDEAERLARNLYDSIFSKILPLGDGVMLCPAHGGGSVCGAAISEREESTLGLERRTNPRLQMTEEDFVELKRNEKLPVPPYFRLMEKHNLEGPPLLGGLPTPQPLEPVEFEKLMEEGAITVDTRLPPAFAGAHIPGSLSIWLDGIPMIAGWALPYDRPLLLVLGNRGHAEQAARYLVRLGYDRVAGYLCNGPEGCGLEAWYAAGRTLRTLKILSIQGLKHHLDKGEAMTLLDVRSQRGWEEGHISAAVHIPSEEVRSRLHEIPRDRPIVTVCTVGNHSTHVASILLQEGYGDVSTVIGGMRAWNEVGYALQA